MRNKLLILFMTIVMLFTAMSPIAKAEEFEEPKPRFELDCLPQQVDNELTLLLCQLDTVIDFGNVDYSKEQFTNPVDTVEVNLKLSKGSSLQGDFKLIDGTNTKYIRDYASNKFGDYEVYVSENDNREINFTVKNFGKASTYSDAFSPIDRKLLNHDNDAVTFGIVYRNEELKEPVEYSYTIKVNGEEVDSGEDVKAQTYTLEDLKGYINADLNSEEKTTKEEIAEELYGVIKYLNLGTLDGYMSEVPNEDELEEPEVVTTDDKKEDEELEEEPAEIEEPEETEKDTEKTEESKEEASDKTTNAEDSSSSSLNSKGKLIAFIAIVGLLVVVAIFLIRKSKKENKQEDK